MAEARRSPAGLLVTCIAGVVLLSAAAFLAGMWAAMRGVFPYPQASAAYSYLVYVAQLARKGPYRDDEFRLPCPTSTGSQSGSGHVLLTLFNGVAYEARIIARDGTTKQQWKLDLAAIVARSPPAVEWTGWKNFYRIHGVHLTPEGDLYLAISGTQTYPAGMVLARAGADGAVRWTAPINAHHDVAVSASGKVYALGMRPRVPPVALEDGGRGAAPEVWSFIKRHDFHLLDPRYDDHFIAVLGQDGSLLDEINLREALSPFPGVYVPSFEGKAAWSSDPMHANALDVIEADTGPFRKGDILVSFRNLNALAVIDGSTHKAKWMLRDRFVTQHGAKVTASGDVVVLDNLGGRAGCGPTRALLIDPVSQAIRKVFELCGPGAIASAVRGNVHLTADGGALITSTQQGRAVELDGETGAVRWEYYNVLGPDPGQAGYCRLGSITEAVPLDRLLVAVRTAP